MRDLTKSTYPRLHVYFYFKTLYKSLKIARKDWNMQLAYSRLHKRIIMLDGNSIDRWKQSGMKSID